MQFVETYYLLALVNTKDKGHKLAIQHSRGLDSRLITTTWVLVEFADALRSVDFRVRAAKFLRGFEHQPFVEMVPPTREQFDRALDRFQNRADKAWSLIDCLSFLLMEERGIAEALTADHQFEQAGFRALMRQQE